MVVKTNNRVTEEEEKRFSIEMEESEGSIDECAPAKVVVTKPDSGINI